MFKKKLKEFAHMIGLHDKNHITEADVDPEELAMGLKVEMEHVDKNVDIAKQISLDHLVEIPDYYTRLARMEEEAKKDGKFNKNIKR